MEPTLRYRHMVCFQPQCTCVYKLGTISVWSPHSGTDTQCVFQPQCTCMYKLGTISVWSPHSGTDTQCVFQPQCTCMYKLGTISVWSPHSGTDTQCVFNHNVHVCNGLVQLVSGAHTQVQTHSVFSTTMYMYVQAWYN